MLAHSPSSAAVQIDSWGDRAYDVRGPTAQRSQNQELLRETSETPTVTRQGSVEGEFMIATILRATGHDMLARLVSA